jgi:hypothetical protein
MPKSIKQLQAELLSSGTLNQLGASKEDFTELEKLPVLEQYLILAAANFIQKVKDNIEVLGISDTGALSDDIAQGDLIKESNGYSISLGYPANSKAAKYYDFVNKGVKGVKSGTPNSPYSFKNLGISRSMLKNIYSWVNRNGIKRNDVSITKRQAKRESLSKMVSEASKKKSIAYAVAVNIKKKGLKKTGYFDNAVQEYFGNDFSTAISKMIGQDVKILIRQDGNNNQ